MVVILKRKLSDTDQLMRNLDAIQETMDNKEEEEEYLVIKFKTCTIYV